MKRNLICFSASRDTSITSLSCSDTEEESDKETDESNDDGMEENGNESTSSSRSNYAMIMIVKLSKQSGHISSKSMATCYQNEL